MSTGTVQAVLHAHKRHDESDGDSGPEGAEGKVKGKPKGETERAAEGQARPSSASSSSATSRRQRHPAEEREAAASQRPPPPMLKSPVPTDDLPAIQQWGPGYSPPVDVYFSGRGTPTYGSSPYGVPPMSTLAPPGPPLGSPIGTPQPQNSPMGSGYGVGLGVVANGQGPPLGMPLGGPGFVLPGEGMESCSSTRPHAPPGNDSMLRFAGLHSIVFNKERFIERLILEEAMMWRLPRCLLFLVQFGLFMTMLWISYPSIQVLPVHKALVDALTVDGYEPSDVHTLEELKSYVAGLATSWRDFSPGSLKYAEDPLAKMYLDSVTEFPDVVNLPSTLKPTLGQEFTITAWIKTGVRFDTLMQTVQVGRGSAVCWQFDLERVVYGQHETQVAVEIVHPLAEDIYVDGVTQDEVWKKSDFRSTFSDNNWHHVAYFVETDHIYFAIDGNLTGSQELPRPITDCDDATFTLGSASQSGYMVDIKYIPRLLTQVELSFLQTKGKLLDDMLAGSGVSVSTESDMDTLTRLAEETQTHVTDQVTSLSSDLESTFRALQSNFKDMLESSDTTTSATLTTFESEIIDELDSLSSTITTQLSSMEESVASAQSATEDNAETLTGITEQLRELGNDLSDLADTFTTSSVSGGVVLSVDLGAISIDEFMADSTVTTAMKETVAEIGGCPSIWVEVSLTSTRRLEEVKRELAIETLTVTYSVTVPGLHEYAGVTSTTITTALTCEVGDATATSFGEIFGNKTSVGTTVTEVTTTPESVSTQSQEPPSRRLGHADVGALKSGTPSQSTRHRRSESGNCCRGGAPERFLTEENTTDENDTNSTDSNTSESTDNSTNSSNSTSSSTSGCEDQDDDSYCWPLRFKSLMWIGDDTSSDAYQGHVAYSLVTCLRSIGDYEVSPDVLEQSEETTLAQLTSNSRHPLLPQDGSCDIVTGCADTNMSWTDSYGQTCYDYEAIHIVDGVDKRLCEDGGKGSLASLSFANFDSEALSVCCVCGGGQEVTLTCSDSPSDWRSVENYTCSDYETYLDCTANAASNSNGVTNNEACCECSGGTSVGQNITAWELVDLVDNWEHPSQGWTCDDYYNKGFCDEDGNIYTEVASSLVNVKGGGGGGGDVSSAIEAVLLAEGTGGYTAWEACAVCGGGQLSYENKVAEQARLFLLEMLGPGDSYLCNSDDIEDEFREACKSTCYFCDMDDAPTTADAQRALLQCNDETYTDWLGQSCSWYLENDAATDDDAACSRYADSTTTEKCKKTCNTCEHAANMVDAFDTSGDGKLSLLEFNAMAVAVGLDVQPATQWQSYIQAMCYAASDYTEACWATTNYPTPYKSLFTKGSTYSELFASLAEEILSELQSPSSFFPSSTLGRVLSFPDTEILNGSANLAIQEELRSTIFQSCTSDSDCTENVTACGNVDADNPICTRVYVIPMYCGTVCRTGGCGTGGGVLPGTSGSYCQPCDGCVLETSTDCPSHCSGYTWETGQETFEKEAEAEMVPAAERGTLGLKSEDEEGSFTLSAWVKDFSTQWIFSKQIYLPNLIDDDDDSEEASKWEGYDSSTGYLTCWRMSYSELQFRNRWDETEFTTISNPLSSTISDSPEDWHFIALLKSSYTSTSYQRRDVVQWMVDGELSDQTTNARGELVWDIPEYGFPDCGGEMLILHPVDYESFAGPTDFFDNSTLFPEWSSSWNEQDPDISERSMPLASMDYGMTVLSFKSVDIPERANIRSAWINICAAQTYIDWLANQEDEDCILDSWSTGAVALKIAGVKTGSTLSLHPDLVDSNGDTTSSNTSDACVVSEIVGNSSLRTTNEVNWTIGYDTWRSTSIVQGPDNSTFDEPDSCYVVSADVTSIVAELVEYLDGTGNRRDMSFVFADLDKDWSSCAKESIFDSDAEKAQYEEELDVASATDCGDLRRRNEFMINKLPIWMVPLTDYSAGRAGAAKATLEIRYCMNDECTSPSFLGAGQSAENTMWEYLKYQDSDGTESSSRRLREHEPREESPKKPRGRPRAAPKAPERTTPPTQKPRPRRRPPSRPMLNGASQHLNPSRKSRRPKSLLRQQRRLRETEGRDTGAVAAATAASSPSTTGPWRKGRSPTRKLGGKDNEMTSSANVAAMPGHSKRSRRRKKEESARKARRARSTSISSKADRKTLPQALAARRAKTKNKKKKLRQRQFADPLALRGLPSNWSAITRRLGTISSTSATSCSASTCLTVGEVLDTGLSTEGLIYSPTFTFRAMAVSELQESYYSSLSTLSPSGEDAISGPQELLTQEDSDATVAEYTKEVVSIIPPVIFQQRSQVVNCSEQSPALASSLEAYFKKQVDGRCSSTYTCDRETGFVCIDRTQNVPKTETHFDTETLEVDDGVWYPEFLDMFTVPVVYRSSMVSTTDWLDLQTSKVMIINIFFSPALKSGTVLKIEFSYLGPGRIVAETQMQSFIQMQSDDRSIWYIINWTVFALAILDIVFVFLGILHQRYKRSKTFKELKKVTEEQAAIIKRHIPVWSLVDVFDICLRSINFLFCVWHNASYPEPSNIVIDDNTVSIDNYESSVKDILDLDWGNADKSTESKVTEFMTKVVTLNDALSAEERHRTFAKLLVLLFFIRIVIYMRVHPKIAVLYATIVEMSMDFVHFCVVFFSLFAVLAFLGMWSFGDKDIAFGDFGSACYTQFRLLAGDWDVASGSDSGVDTVFGVWLVTYFLMVFSLLLNFFLAIVVDSYANVKDAVQTCKVESDVLWDITTTVLYPILAVMYGWPGRSSMVEGLMRNDLNQDFRNDEDGGVAVPVTADHLDKFAIVRGRASALFLMRYYRRVCPALLFSYVELPAELEHKRIMRRLEALDHVRYEVIGERHLGGFQFTKNAEKLDQVHSDVRLLKEMMVRLTTRDREGGASFSDDEEGEDRELRRSAQSVISGKECNFHSVGDKAEDVRQTHM